MPLQANKANKFDTLHLNTQLPRMQKPTGSHSNFCYPHKSNVYSMQSLFLWSNIIVSKQSCTLLYKEAGNNVYCIGNCALIDRTVLYWRTVFRLRGRVPLRNILHHGFHCLACRDARVPVGTPQIVQNLQKSFCYTCVYHVHYIAKHMLLIDLLMYGTCRFYVHICSLAFAHEQGCVLCWTKTNSVGHPTMVYSDYR